MTECQHGSLPDMCPVEGCEHRADDSPDGFEWVKFEDDPPAKGSVVEAMYPGVCDDCGLAIVVGTKIFRSTGGWAHLNCNDAEVFS